MKQMKRWRYVFVGMAILLFAGMVYAWSIFCIPIAQEYPQWSQAGLSFAFTIVMIFFCIGCIAGGVLSNRIRARSALWVSAVLFFAGFWISSNVQTLLMLYIGFGIICGFASGLAYNTVMTTVGRWFPDRQGLISGTLLMGFGLSSFIIGKVYQAITPETIGAWRQTFLMFGIVTAIILTLAGCVLKKPAANFQPSIASHSPKTYINQVAIEAKPIVMLRKPSFWFYYLWAILLSAASMALVSQAGGIAREICGTKMTTLITTAVGLISVFNGIGRVIAGSLFDKVGCESIMQATNIIFIIAGLLLMAALKAKSIIILLIGFILGGLAFGGVPPANSAFISLYYGMEHYPMNFSIVNTNLIIASFGSTVAGALYDANQSYMSTYWMVCILSTVGVIAVLAISACNKRELKRKQLHF